MKKILLLGVVFCAAALPFGPKAFAGTASSSFNVTATVTSSCTISAADMAFGTYDPVNGTTATTEVDIGCTGVADGNLPFTVDGGDDYGTSGTYRNMSAGSGEFLPYEIGATVNGADIGNSANNGVVDMTGGSGTETLYGTLAPGLISVPASVGYTDTVGLSVSY